MSIAETLTGFIPATPARREAKRAAAVARAVADAEERTHALLRRRLLDSHLSAGQLVKLAAGAFGTIDVERVTRGERVPHAVAAAMVPSLFAGMTLTDAWEIKPAPGNRGPNANVPQDRPTAPAPATDSSTGAPSPIPTPAPSKRRAVCPCSRNSPRARRATPSGASPVISGARRPETISPRSPRPSIGSAPLTTWKASNTRSPVERPRGSTFRSRRRPTRSAPCCARP